MTPPNPSAHLVELGKAKAMGAMDKDGIYIGKINAGFYDRRANENINLAT